jgi:ADP-ribosylglycohydrolase
MDEKIKDKIRGSFFSAAIGDALGVGAEFKTKAEVKRQFPGGLRRFDQLTDSRSFKVGEWTDDMSQALLVANTLLEKNEIDQKLLAQKLHHWFVTDGRGCGSTTIRVFSQPQLLIDPEAVAVEVWKSQPEGKNAANGALMKIFPTGLWDCWDHQIMTENTGKACLVTHPDSRCVNSCLVQAFLLSRLIMEPEKMEVIAKEKTFLESLAHEMDPDDKDFLDAVTYKKNIEDLHLGTKIGYTYRALSAAIWALYNATSVEHGIVSIINEGGDADTNACVAGALIGAKFGLNSIPVYLVDGLVKKDELMTFVEKFISAMEARYAN